MSAILTFISVQNGSPSRASLEALTRARQISEEQGKAVAAVMLTPDATQPVDVLARFGAQKVYTVSHPVFAQHINTPVLVALEQVFNQVNP
ncbi:MAG: electron transfer flavoprotein subunit alpha/FixB family protein, partial [Rubricoccaceae bacterium]|nr:electron transfer flavoprotein subunit alpha/FixB family protein [Rubricoccaceae bacterium]